MIDAIEAFDRPVVAAISGARALWEDPAVLAKRVKESPLPRIGEPDEVAGAAVFLASSAGSFHRADFRDRWRCHDQQRRIGVRVGLGEGRT